MVFSRSLAVTCALALAGLIAVPGYSQTPSTEFEAAAAMEKAFVEIIARAEKSVVAIARVRKARPGENLTPEFRPDPFNRRGITAARPEPTEPDFVPNEFATGVIVDGRGLVLTVYHVLAEESEYYITLHDRKVFRAKILGADPRSDLAVLAPDESSLPHLGSVEFAPIALGDVGTVKKGQIVLTLGNPYAIARDGQASASWGILANLARKAPAAPDEAEPTGKGTVHHFGTLLQTDARLNRGTSGSPLLNLRGEMIGLTTAIPALPGYDDAAGYAIPVDAMLRRALEMLKQGREVEYGFLGIQPTNLGMDETLKGLQGTRVYRVVPGTPAYRNGVKAGDLVTTVNGVSVHDADSLVREVSRLPIDATVRLGILRGGRKVTIEADLTKCHVRGKKIVTAPAPDWRGMRIDYASAVDDSARTGYPLAMIAEAVAVTEVEKGTPAWEAGLRPGMLVSHVDRTAVRTPRQFREAVANKGGPVRLRLTGEAGDSSDRVVPPNG